jgi:hypothetical protein
MRKTIWVLLACLVVAVGALVVGRPESSAVKLCRADAQKFAEENASYEAEYDSLYGATTLAQRPIRELLDRDDELMSCIANDPHHAEQYKAVLYRKRFYRGQQVLCIHARQERPRRFSGLGARTTGNTASEIRSLSRLRAGRTSYQSFS